MTRRERDQRVIARWRALEKGGDPPPFVQRAFDRESVRILNPDQFLDLAEAVIEFSAPDPRERAGGWQFVGPLTETRTASGRRVYDADEVDEALIRLTEILGRSDGRRPPQDDD